MLDVRQLLLHSPTTGRNAQVQRVRGLTDKDIADICESTDRQWRIAQRYGISQTTVSNIRIRCGKRSRKRRDDAYA